MAEVHLVNHKTAIIWSFAQNYCGLLEVPLLHSKISGVWSFSQNRHQLPEVPLVQPKISIIWSFTQNQHQLPEVPLVQPKIGILWSYSQNYYQLPCTWTDFNIDQILTGQQSDCKTCVLRCAPPQVKMCRFRFLPAATLEAVRSTGAKWCPVSGVWCPLLSNPT